MKDLQVLIIGGGLIGYEYLKILSELGINSDIISRSSKSNVPKNKIIIDDIFEFPKNKLEKYNKFIVAVQPSFSLDIVKYILNNTNGEILVEKPFVLNSSKILEIENKLFEKRVFVALNRRWFKSILESERILKLSKPLNISIEFTEHLSRIRGTDLEKKYWAIANSIHVIDMGLHLIGIPKIDYIRKKKIGQNRYYINVYSKKNNTDITLFSIWGGAGNWSIEFRSYEYRLILNPIEKLLIQKSESFIKDEIKLNKENDFKEGFMDMTNDFINGNKNKFPSKDYYFKLLKFIEEIMNY